MRQVTLLLAVLAALVLAAPASAQTPAGYPWLLWSAACTDTNDAVAASVTPETMFVQVSGSTDGKCDHDLRVGTGEITGTTVLWQGEWLDSFPPAMLMFYDATSQTGGPGYRINAMAQFPANTGVFTTLEGTGDVTDNNSYKRWIGHTGGTSTSNASALDWPIVIDHLPHGHRDAPPALMRLQFELRNGTTAWEGDISLVPVLSRSAD